MFNVYVLILIIENKKAYKIHTDVQFKNPDVADLYVVFIVVCHEYGIFLKIHLLI